MRQHPPVPRNKLGELRSKGERWAGPDLIVYRLPAESDQVRYTMAVPRSVGGAVVRNRIRRRISHAIREIEIPKGTDLLIVGRTDSTRVPFAQIVDQLRSGAG